MRSTPESNYALLKNPELVEGPFRPAERDQGPEFIEGQRTALDCYGHCSHRLRPQPPFRSGCASPPPSPALAGLGALGG